VNTLEPENLGVEAKWLVTGLYAGLQMEAVQVQALTKVIVSLFLDKTLYLSPSRSIFGCCQILRLTGEYCEESCGATSFPGSSPSRLREQERTGTKEPRERG